MKNENKKVIGSFMARDEAVREIQRLHNLGYSKSEINVYSNPERAQTVERLIEIEVEGADVVQDEMSEDTSWWDTIKDSFGFHAFHSEDGHQMIRIIEGQQEENERKLSDEETDNILQLLKPYQEDLADGKLVIIVDDYGRH